MYSVGIAGGCSQYHWEKRIDVEANLDVGVTSLSGWLSWDGVQVAMRTGGGRADGPPEAQYLHTDN
jgi:hypothetical protein